MFPEAGYSLDGRKTVLPDSIGKLIKLLGVPVVTVITSGAFSRQPLYNELRKRPVPVSAKVEYLLSPEDIKSKNFEQINQLINEKFDFDAFKWQQQNNVVIDDKERAVGLERILYKCPCCGQEKMLGENDTLTCKACGKVYTLTPLGKMQAVDGKTEYEQVADWVDWQRASVKQEIENGSYNLDIPVDVRIMMDAKGVFDVGEGRLIHNENGFTLKGTQQDFTYVQEDSAIYTINADFYWYQVSDVINIGDLEVQYFCFPKDKNVSVFKVRLATEELFKKAQERIKGK